jgi:ubiquinone/menaquinone biosynthesis C-methylase UbiE
LRSVHKAILSEALHKKPLPQTLLDIGCGNGSFTQVLASAFPNTSITAIDTFDSKHFVPSPNSTFVKESVEDLSFESESFDIVVAALSLHHWKDKSKGIGEVYRVLKKGGHLIIGDPLLEDWMSNRFWGWLMQVIDRGFFTDTKRLSRYLDKAGFESANISLIPNSMKSLYLVTATKT